jgi:hypothetical protein
VTEVPPFQGFVAFLDANGFNGAVAAMRNGKEAPRDSLGSMTLRDVAALNVMIRRMFVAEAFMVTDGHVGSRHRAAA